MAIDLTNPVYAADIRKQLEQNLIRAALRLLDCTNSAAVVLPMTIGGVVAVGKREDLQSLLK